MASARMPPTSHLKLMASHCSLRLGRVVQNGGSPRSTLPHKGGGEPEASYFWSHRVSDGLGHAGMGSRVQNVSQGLRVRCFETVASLILSVQRARLSGVGERQWRRHRTGSSQDIWSMTGGLRGQCHDLPKPGLVSCVPIPYRVAATELTVNRWAYRHDGVACDGHNEDRYRGFYTTLSEPLRGRSIRPAG